MRAGRVRDFGTWTSAIGKTPVTGPVSLGAEGLTGDQQADRVHHGGPDKAVLCYPRAHYEAWQLEYGENAPAPGTLGENFEVEGLAEPTACIGDIYAVGDALVQISQPRQPCWKPATFHALPNLTARILKSGRTGWYLRVLRGGSLEVPLEAVLVERPHPAWTVQRASEVMHFGKDPLVRRELGSLVELAGAWREKLL